MKRRVFALIGAIFIPVMLFISIILSIMDSPIAGVFLMITIILAVVLPITVYLLTKLPEDFKDIYFRLKGDKEDEQ